MDLANDLAAAYAGADMVDDPDGWVDALWQELGVPQDADEQQSEGSGEEFVADGPLIEQVVPDDPLMTIWQATLLQSVDTLQRRMQSFKDADAWPVTQADRKFALSLGCKFPLVGSSKESMAMVLLQDPQSGAVRPAYYPMHNVHGYAPIIFDAISHRVISGIVLLVEEDILSRYKCPIQMHSPMRNTTGFRVVIPDIGIVMSKCRPVERQQAPEYVHRIQSMVFIAASPVVLHQECYVCGQGCEDHALATCPVCMLTAHPDCISEHLCNVKLNVEPELPPGDVFNHDNVCCLCSACFSFA